MYHYDVVVVGGGVSGAVAGIASARMGARTLVIDKMAFLGGSLTAAGVGPMMTFHAGNTQVVRGIAEEVVQRLKALGGSLGHIPDGVGYTYTVTPFDAEMLKHVLENMYIEAGGEVLYHGMLCGVEVGESIIRSIAVATKSGQLRFKANIFIDATGDGDLSAWAGVDFQLGREYDSICQPITMNLKVGNIDIDKVKKYIYNDPEDFPAVDREIIKRAPRLSMGGFKSYLDAARKNGEISFDREYILMFETNNPGECILNTTRIQRINPTDAWELTKGEVEGRRQALELYNFLKKRVPGFEHAVMVYTGPNVGVRESRKIKGKYVLTAEDLFCGNFFYDEIACGGYQIDIHNINGEKSEKKHLPWGTSYGIPLRSLLNNKVENLVTVGRCISVTHEACGAVRVTPIAMAIGHAGGAAAAMASNKGNRNVSDIDYKEIREELKSQGAYLR